MSHKPKCVDPQQCDCPDDPETERANEEATRLTREDRYTYEEWQERRATR